MKILFIKILSVAALLATASGCFVSTSISSADTTKNTSAETETKSTYENKYNIELTAEYNETKNTVDAVLTNNTGGLYAFLEDEHYFYKQNGNAWENITFNYGTVWSSVMASPKAGENTCFRSYAAYQTTNDNGNDINKAAETKLTPGKYKTAVLVSVCDPLEYAEIDSDSDGKTETVPIYEKNKVSFLKEAYFTVE